MPAMAKRSDQKHGHRDNSAGILKAKAGPKVDPGPPDEYWADTPKRMWEALKISGQSQFFEATDWEYARYVCEAMSRNLHQGGKMSAVMMANVQSGLADLLCTEGSRRRIKLELIRGNVEDEDEAGSLALVAEYKSGAGQSNTA